MAGSQDQGPYPVRSGGGDCHTPPCPPREIPGYSGASG